MPISFRVEIIASRPLQSVPTRKAKPGFLSCWGFALVVGFAAETGAVVEKARAKRARKGCDWIIANDVSSYTNTLGGTTNMIHLIDGKTVEKWPRMTKEQVGTQLARRIADYFD